MKLTFQKPHLEHIRVCHYEFKVMPTKAPATFDGMIFESSNSRQLYFRSFANNYFRRLETKKQMNVAGPTRREVKKEKAYNSSYFSSFFGFLARNVSSYSLGILFLITLFFRPWSEFLCRQSGGIVEVEDSSLYGTKSLRAGHLSYRAFEAARRAIIVSGCCCFTHLFSIGFWAWGEKESREY